MDELATLDALENRLGLLRADGDTETRITNAAAFTRAAAWALREAGWGNVRKTSGENREGLDVDKILNRHTLEMRDIVIAAGSSAARVGWQLVATGSPAQWVAPQPPPGEQPPAPAPVPVEPVDGERFLELLDDIEQHLRRLADSNERMAVALEAAFRRFGG